MCAARGAATSRLPRHARALLYLSPSLSLSGYAEVLTASGVTIPLVCCMPRGGRAAEKRHCLLFSHGNAEDLGETLPFLKRCAEYLQLPVIGFEYPGY